MFRNLSLILSFSILGLFACQQAEEKKAEITAEPQLASVEMKVEGMVCAMGCAKFIQDKVAEEAGVTESKVDFESETAYFTYDANQWTAEELEQFIDGIHDGQYDATIVAQGQDSTPAEALEDAEEEAIEETDDEDGDNEEVDVAQVVNKVQNISFPELLTYFMKRL
jgi:copper chaperone CopZ